MIGKNGINEDVDFRLGEITQVIQSIAGGNFAAKAGVTSKLDVIDALAIGVNMLAEELEAGTLGLEYVENRIDEILKVVQSCARGDYIFCEPSEKNDIFDALSMGLNMMIDDIRYNYQEIQATQKATLNIMEDLDKRGKELNKINKQLQQEITERKNAENELRETLKELKVKNKELDDYLYMISHDLKAPLVTIQGFGALLKRKYGNELDEGAMHYVDTIISGAQDLNTLVTDILALSRARRGAHKKANVSLLDVVHSCIRSLQSIIETKGAVVVVPKELPGVLYNPTQLQEVLTNLISNALNYSKPDEKPKIELGCKSAEKEDIIWITDNGIGIEEINLDKIFKPFERIARDQKGTGIGLSIVKSIIEKHGGRIWIESKFGEGSTFYFTVPKEVK